MNDSAWHPNDFEYSLWIEIDLRPGCFEVLVGTVLNFPDPCNTYLILFCIFGQPELRGCEQLIDLLLIQYHKIGFCSHRGCVYTMVMWYASRNRLVNLKRFWLPWIMKNMRNIWKQPSRQEEHNSVMGKVIPIAAVIWSVVFFFENSCLGYFWHCHTNYCSLMSLNPLHMKDFTQIHSEQFSPCLTWVSSDLITRGQQ